jgi:dihydroxy-acid dehydratase
MAFNKRSRHITQGVARSPNRSMYYALGYQKEDFDKPMVGIANGHSTITPCNAGLQRLADAAIDAIRAAGANPQVFGTPTISDGMSMAASARRCRPALHGVMVEWPLAMPTIGLSKSSFW